MSKASDIGGKITQGITEYSGLLTSVLDALGPALSAAKEQFLDLFAQLKQDDLLDEAGEAALRARIAALDKAIEDA